MYTYKHTHAHKVATTVILMHMPFILYKHLINVEGQRTATLDFIIMYKEEFKATLFKSDLPTNFCNNTAL